MKLFDPDFHDPHYELFVVQDKHSSKPTICPVQPTAIPPSGCEGHLAPRMWFVELNTPLNIQLCRSELPNRTVQFGGSEPDHRHCVKEIVPWNFAWGGSRSRIEENHSEYFQSTSIYRECGLRVGLIFFLQDVDFCIRRRGRAGFSAFFGLLFGLSGIQLLRGDSRIDRRDR